MKDMGQVAGASNPLYYPYFLNALLLSMSSQVVYNVVVADSFVDEFGTPFIPANEVCQK
jgi:hypothetical protein